MKKTLIAMAAIVALAMSTMAAATPSGTGILSPSDDEIVITNTLKLRASEPDATGVVAWAVRSAADNPDCGTSQPDLAGWQGGTKQDDLISVTWEDGYFAADINVSGWDRADYCFAFNPEPFGTYRDTVIFALGTATSKDACKDGGWETFGDYKNQGECVSEFARSK